MRLGVTVAVIGLALALASCGGDDEPEPGAGAGGGGGGLECEEPTKVLFAHYTPESSPYQVGGEAFGAYLEENAPGCFEYTISSGGALGAEVDILQQMQAGAVQLGVGVFGLSQFVPEATLLGVPFLYRDGDHAREVLTGPVGDELAKRVREKANLEVLGVWTAGVFSLLSKEEVTSPDDFDGMRIRVAPAPVLLAVWEELGANPQEIPYPEIYTALQTGTVEAFDQDPVNLTTIKTQEVAKNYALTEHMPVVPLFMANGEFYDGLSPELREVVDAAGEAAMEAEVQAYGEAETKALQTMEDAGVTIEPFDSGPLRERVRATFEKFPKELPADLLEQIE